MGKVVSKRGPEGASAVIKTEHNYVLNPRHADYTQISLTIIHDTLDKRLHDLGNLTGD